MTAGIARARCALIAAAGTGGHVIPGVEVGKELRERGWECVFIGTARGFENRLVPQAGFELLHVPVGALNRVSFRRRLATLLSVPRALAVALRIVSQRRPAAALSLGGYAAGPLALASVLAEVPLVLMEPNAFPGLANRLAAPAACRVLLGHPAAATFFRAGSCQLTGMPVRREFFRIAPRDPGSPFTVLVLGRQPGRGAPQPRPRSTPSASGARAASGRRASSIRPASASTRQWPRPTARLQSTPSRRRSSTTCPLGSSRPTS